ncbi:ABC transporter ATP-binding protein [Pelagicoccus enzymogenes]|uniref:ABC transporter ATP-binding protein n=1 Tax=Pelagicoccus enzymogenes TaxID=2773457 RepID=UPI00280E9056|nr:ABC transporter ATP-binding protein [Pelagicoccus enzymogenes]MDQ8199303.1 ABC transporter ATP-binding protein [Pelagicoccus enzymogenes]
MSLALEAVSVSVGYEGKGTTARVVASGLTVSLKAGEFVCLLGPNGVGKSTLIRTLAGMQKPISGSIRIADTDLKALSPKQKARAVSVVLTDSLPQGMFDAYSVVALGRHPHTGWTGSLAERDRQRIEWALQAVGAGGLARRQVSELSDGERQKIMIARALAQETKLILLDEPTAFLDLPRRVELMRTLRDLARNEGLSILLSTHDLDLALRSADRLWLLDSEGGLTTGIPEELAYAGEIANAFRSSEVDWDNEQGAFKMHNRACASVTLHGSGAIEVWTRRALARIGYEVGSEKSESKIRIQIEARGNGFFWKVESEEGSERFESLHELLQGLLGRSHQAANGET